MLPLPALSTGVPSALIVLSPQCRDQTILPRAQDENGGRKLRKEYYARDLVWDRYGLTF